MLELVRGNLLEANTQTLVNTVNCVGVMGKGIALDFKNRFPAMFRDYVHRCKNNQVRLGEPYLFRQLLEPWIVNFPTKDHWRSQSRIRDIESGLDYLDRHITLWGISSIAIPPLGCGNGQLEWVDVGPLIARKLEHHDIPIQLFVPPGTPDDQLNLDFLLTPTGRADADR